jgi:predicted nucleotidyltransferase component of viral defense system
MIYRDEIEAKSNELGVHVANVERDYVFGWLLRALYESPFLAPRLICKGGNCMRKAYYPNTRFSTDLDFGVTSAIDADAFGAEINRCCGLAQQACGVVFETDKNTFAADRMIDSQRQAYKGRVYFRDFYGNSGEITIAVRLDITEFDRVFLSAVRRPLIHPYSDAADCRAEIQCMAMEELLANKLKCLLQRRHSYDLYDFVYATFFEQSVPVDRGLVLSTFLRKTIFERSPGSAKQILLGLPMAFFKGAWEKYLVAPLASRFDFERIPDAFATALNSIFGDVLPAGWGADPFYPAEYRNQILEAGSQKKLMRIGYDGRERLIEPYSLAYKKPQNGYAREYFYAYDCTGGQRSGPGIKTFLHERIQSLSITEDAFEPRYEIELSKSGEAPKRSYFGSPFGGVRARSPRSRAVSRSSRNPFAPSYTVQCPYCLKTFKRSKASTLLSAHKDSNGYPCHGRRGYLV